MVPTCMKYLSDAVNPLFDKAIPGSMQKGKCKEKLLSTITVQYELLSHLDKAEIFSILNIIAIFNI
jgi:hypothetical protein